MNVRNGDVSDTELAIYIVLHGRDKLIRLV